MRAFSLYLWRLRVVLLTAPLRISARPVHDMLLEMRRWEAQGLARFRQPLGSAEFARRCRDVNRRVADCYRSLEQLFDTPGPAPR